MLLNKTSRILSVGRRQFSTKSGASFPTFKGHTQLFINNKFVDAVSGKTFETHNPSTGEVITKVADGQKEDIDLAVKAARKAFDEGEWRKMDPRDRGRLMYKFAELLDANRDELAKLESLDNGKPYKDSYNVDLFLAIDCIRYYAGWADKISGSVLNIRGDFNCFVRREALGVVGQIIPWNFPILMLAWKLGPALATGCTVVVKPAEQTPLTALKVAQLLVEAGFPPGVVNIVTGQGETAGAPLVKHHLVDKIAFTGSTEVGKHILRDASHDLKRVSLELGGKSPVIVFADADMDRAIEQTHIGLFLNQGQCCIAGSRIYVENKIYDEFVHRAAEKAKARKVGHPFESTTDQGPQVSQEQFDRVMHYIGKGKSEGAKLVAGGNRVGKQGFFIEPTVFSDVKDDMTISQEEIFGPVMGISRFTSIDEVINRSNKHIYGLGAAVFTENLSKAHSVANRVRAGTVYVNCYDIFDASAPFGGYKQSGHGRELGPSGLELYLEDKTVILPVYPNSK